MRLNKIIYLLIFAILLIPIISAAECASRGRPVLQNGVLKTDNGNVLIGEHIALTYWNNGRYNDPDIYKELSSYNMNTVRLLVYRQPVSSCDNDPKNCDTKEVAATRIKAALDVLTPLGFYAIIDYHPVGYYDEADAIAWWTYIAPKFANYTNVIYELTNEPHENAHPVTDATVEYERKLHKIVRAKAPKTPIIIWSLAYLNNYNAQYVSKLGKIDSNTIVGFHTYNPRNLSLIPYLRNQGFTLLMTEDQRSGYCGDYNPTVECYNKNTALWMEQNTGFILLKAYPIAASGHPDYLKSMNITWPKDLKVNACSASIPVNPTPITPPVNPTPITPPVNPTPITPPVNPTPITPPVNLPPSNPLVSIISVDNTINSDIICKAYIDDSDSASLGVHIEWYKNGGIYSVLTFNNQKPKTTISNTLTKSNLKINDLWYCKVRVYDIKTYTSWISSKTIKIIPNEIPLINEPTADPIIPNETPVINEPTADPIITSDIVRINAGGTQYIDTQDNIWMADEYYNNGSSSSTGSDILGTEDDALYQTSRWDSLDLPELSYNIPLENGDYELTLHFAETWPGAFNNNMRVFDVYAQDTLLIDDIDIYKEVGENTKLIKTYQVSVENNNLEIRFVHVIQNPAVSAIEIHKVVNEKPKKSSGGGGSSKQPTTTIINNYDAEENLNNETINDTNIIHENIITSKPEIMKNTIPLGANIEDREENIPGKNLITGGVITETRSNHKPFIFIVIIALSGVLVFIIRKRYAIDINQSMINYISSAINGGYSYDTVSDVLLNKGFKKRIVKYHIKIVQSYGTKHKFTNGNNPITHNKSNATILQKYVRQHINEGFRIEDIRQVLIQHGYPEDTINEAIYSD